MGAWENPIIETSKWNTFLNQFYQGQPNNNSTLTSRPKSPTENVTMPFSDPVGALHHESSSFNFGEPLYQDCFPDPLEPMFQLESFERSSRAQGKLPMFDSHTQSEFPNDELYDELATKPIDWIAEDSPEFEKRVRDSWVFICNYDKGENKLIEETIAEEAILEIPPPVRPEKRYKSLNKLSIIPKEIDTSKFPDPICSCTGAPRKCYRWGDGGWTSSCCTAKFSQSPLPCHFINGRKQRKVGRKMSSSTYRKVVEKLYSTGYDFCNPIDLKDYWAKLGTNQSEIKW